MTTSIPHEEAVLPVIKLSDPLAVKVVFKIDGFFIYEYDITKSRYIPRGHHRRATLYIYKRKDRCSSGFTVLEPNSDTKTELLTKERDFKIDFKNRMIRLTPDVPGLFYLLLLPTENDTISLYKAFLTNLSPCTPPSRTQTIAPLSVDTPSSVEKRVYFKPRKTRCEQAEVSSNSKPILPHTHVPVKQKPEPIKPEPIKLEAIKPEPIKLESIKPEPIKLEAIKPEPIKLEAIKPEPINSDVCPPIVEFKSDVLLTSDFMTNFLQLYSSLKSSSKS
ncbi:hypothetical protein RCL1_003628 [Eukaryota sp. TZLM3-RCL]